MDIHNETPHRNEASNPQERADKPLDSNADVEQKSKSMMDHVKDWFGTLSGTEKEVAEQKLEQQQKDTESSEKKPETTIELNEESLEELSENGRELLKIIVNFIAELLKAVGIEGFKPLDIQKVKKERISGTLVQMETAEEGLQDQLLYASGDERVYLEDQLYLIREQRGELEQRQGMLQEQEVRFEDRLDHGLDAISAFCQQHGLLDCVVMYDAQRGSIRIEGSANSIRMLKEMLPRLMGRGSVIAPERDHGLINIPVHEGTFAWLEAQFGQYVYVRGPAPGPMPIEPVPMEPVPGPTPMPMAAPVPMPPSAPMPVAPPPVAVERMRMRNHIDVLYGEPIIITVSPGLAAENGALRNLPGNRRLSAGKEGSILIEHARGLPPITQNLQRKSFKDRYTTPDLNPAIDYLGLRLRTLRSGREPIGTTVIVERPIPKGEYIIINGDKLEGWA